MTLSSKTAVFCERPLRHGGYGISDFHAVGPEYGNMDDVKVFVDAAHETENELEESQNGHR